MPKGRFMVPGERNCRLVSIKKIAGSRWLFRCDCGKDCSAIVGAVRFGNTKSCGCLDRERRVEFNRRTKRKHGMHGSPEYRAWMGMKARCKNKNLKDYGGRGITVYGPWQRSFEMFLKHVGLKPTPDHSLDRINNSKGYFPGNVRWATIGEQQRNRRGNHVFVIGGKKMCAEEAARALGIPNTAIYARLRYGWTTKRIIDTPIKKMRRSSKT